MIGDWIIETPTNGGTDELCIAKIRKQEQDDLGINIFFSKVLILRPEPDDEDRVGSKLVICSDFSKTNISLMFDERFIYPKIDENIAHYDAIKAVFAFKNW